MSRTDTDLHDETLDDMDPGVARCDLCGLTTDHDHSWEEWGFTVEAGPFDGPEALPAPDEAELDDMERCYCRRCLLHDDPGGCLVAEARWRAEHPELAEREDRAAYLVASEWGTL